MTATRRIGLLIERSRAFGRLMCEGIITHAQDREWEIRYLEPDDLRGREIATFDGFVARVTTDEIARLLAATKKPVVDVFYNLPDYGFAIVKERHESIGRLAAEHFLDRRFRNFAYCPYGSGKTSVYCRTAYVQRLRREGVPCDVFASSSEIAYPSDGREIIGDRIAAPRDAKPLANWLKRLPKPVAVFCPDDLRAWQVLATCAKCGIKVPDEIAILGLDNDILICGGAHPMLSSIDPNTREIGRVAAETLETLMTAPARRPIVRQVEPTGVVSRASTAIFPLDPPWLSDALIFIGRHVADGVSAADVLRHLGRSHTLVSRAFAKTLGTTVQKEIARVRIETACNLLRTTSLPLEEVAARSGFATYTYFMQAFTAALKTPPGAWRQHLLHQATESETALAISSAASR